MNRYLANDRLEIDQVVTRGSAFAGCDMRELHTALARDGRAEAVTLDGDGTAVAANEFLYKRSVAIAPLASDPRDDLSPEAIAACVETLRREVAGSSEVKDVIDVRLMVVDSDSPVPALGNGAAMMTQHRQLYRATAFVRRYTQAPLRFAMPLPALMRIFDDVKYQHLEGRLLEGIARLFGSNVRVLAYPCPPRGVASPAQDGLGTRMGGRRYPAMDHCRSDASRTASLVVPMLANAMIILCGYCAGAALVWGIADARMDQPQDFAGFGEPGQMLRKWRVAHLSDIHTVGMASASRVAAPAHEAIRD